MTTQEIEKTENEFNAYARQAEEAPHKWGEEQEAELTKIQMKLRRLYDAAGTDDFDRIQGI